MHILAETVFVLAFLAALSAIVRHLANDGHVMLQALKGERFPASMSGLYASASRPQRQERRPVRLTMQPARRRFYRQDVAA